VFGQNLPAAGGGYLRIFPLAYTIWVFRKFEKQYNERVVLYLHPWELDPEQPRIREKLRSRIRHYTNLKKMGTRLEALMRDFEFCPFRATLPMGPLEDNPAPLQLQDLEQLPSALVGRELSVDSVKNTEFLHRRLSPGIQLQKQVTGEAKSYSARFLTYHAIETQASRTAYTVSPEQFEEHLSVVAEFESAKTKNSGSTGVTFDDGHVSNFEHALPLLTKYSRTGIFFIVGSFVGERPGYMTWAHVREMSRLGHQIQSHSWSHPLLTHCTEDKLRDELMRSKSVLEDKLARNIDALAVPGGRWNGRVLRAAARAGYTRVYVSDPWIGRSIREGVEMYGRLTVKQNMRPDQLRQLLIGEGFYAASFRARYELKEMFRRVVGDSTYRSFWMFLVRQKEGKTVIPTAKSLQKG
jgi:hypothetical protein